jgi:GNAT superfamily N-acetyltransferase
LDIHLTATLPIPQELDAFFDEWHHHLAASKSISIVSPKIQEIRKNLLEGKIHCVWIQQRQDGPYHGGIFFKRRDQDMYVSTLFIKQKLLSPDITKKLFANVIKFVNEKQDITRIIAEIECDENEEYSSLFSPTGFLPFIRLEMALPLSKVPKSKIKLKKYSFRQIDWKIDTPPNLAQVGLNASKDTPDTIIDGTFGDLERYTEFINVAKLGHMGKRSEILSWIVHDKKSEEVIGYVLAAVTKEDVGTILDVAVLPEYQKQGVGKALLSLSLGSMIGSGLKTCTLEVIESNPALALYKNLGYSETRRECVQVWDPTIKQ